MQLCHRVNILHKLNESLLLEPKSKGKAFTVYSSPSERTGILSEPKS